MASRSLRIRTGPRLQSIFLDTLRTRPLPSTPAYISQAKLASPRRNYASHRSAFVPTSILRAQTTFKPTYRKNATSTAAAPATTASNSPPISAPPSSNSTTDLTTGFNDPPALNLAEDPSQPVDWTRSFHGLSTEPFPKEITDILLAPIDEADVEVKPDGIIYLPEIKYRRILQKAFRPGGWGLAPRGETIVTGKSVTREYALVAHGRLISISRGEQDYFSPEGIPTAAEGCKSNAMVRCCKDLGIASELWDPRFIQQYLSKYAKEVFVEHMVTKKKKKIFLRKDDVVRYPFKEMKGF